MCLECDFNPSLASPFAVFGLGQVTECHFFVFLWISESLATLTGIFAFHSYLFFKCSLAGVQLWLA